MLNIPHRFRRHHCISLFLIITSFITLHLLFVHLRQIPAHHIYNASLRKTPHWLKPLTKPISGIIFSQSNLVSKPPEYFHELMNSTWPGEIPLPDLDDGGKLLMLHIFSTISATARSKRRVIRRYSPLLSIPRDSQHLVEVKFILGRSDPEQEMSEEQEAEEAEIQREMERYGDVVRLEGLYHGENMNNGKTWEWMRWVGRQGAKGAWWVIKCDDDTIPILPNLLAELTAQSPKIPTYFGSALGHYPGYHYHFEGMMYGFSWGVVGATTIHSPSWSLGEEPSS